MFGHDNQDENNQHEEFTPTGYGAPADHSDDNSAGPAPGNGDGDVPVVAPPSAPAATPPPAATDDLLDIKQEALQALTPLVGQLDQTPEEQFRTTMMMIQASDNHDLVKVAYEAAKKIANEKERAQALLDIVNEINYFTQHVQS